MRRTVLSGRNNIGGYVVADSKEAIQNEVGTGRRGDADPHLIAGRHCVDLLARGSEFDISIFHTASDQNLIRPGNHTRCGGAGFRKFERSFVGGCGDRLFQVNQIARLN